MQCILKYKNNYLINNQCDLILFSLIFYIENCFNENNSNQYFPLFVKYISPILFTNRNYELEDLILKCKKNENIIQITTNCKESYEKFITIINHKKINNFNFHTESSHEINPYIQIQFSSSTLRIGIKDNRYLNKIELSERRINDKIIECIYKTKQLINNYDYEIYDCNYLTMIDQNIYTIKINQMNNEIVFNETFSKKGLTKSFSLSLESKLIYEKVLHYFITKINNSLVYMISYNTFLIKVIFDWDKLLLLNFTVVNFPDFISKIFIKQLSLNSFHLVTGSNIHELINEKVELSQIHYQYILIHEYSLQYESNELEEINSKLINITIPLHNYFLSFISVTCISYNIFNNEYIVGTNNGLIIKYDHLMNEPKCIKFIVYDQILFIYNDHNKNYLIGTKNKILYFTELSSSNQVSEEIHVIESNGNFIFNETETNIIIIEYVSTEDKEIDHSSIYVIDKNDLFYYKIKKTFYKCNINQFYMFNNDLFLVINKNFLQ